MTVTPPPPTPQSRDNDLSKMAPTPALWALLRWTCSPVASRIPSLIPIERCENDAIRSSFQPAAEMGWGGGGGGEKRHEKQAVQTEVHTAFRQNESDN